MHQYCPVVELVELAELATGGGEEARNRFLFVRNFQCDKTHCCIFSSGQLSGPWILYADVSEHSVCSIFIGKQVNKD